VHGPTCIVWANLTPFSLQNVLLAKAFCPAMIEQGWGRVIAISSVCAMQCAPGLHRFINNGTSES
jgi:hypothetical protein